MSVTSWQGPWRAPWQRACIAGALAVMAVFYAWTASTSEFPARPGSGYGYYYNHLANAFRAGQLHLLIEPRKELLALPDPYDPVANAPYRLHDAVLFKGKYYLYYGPVPALLVYIPFRVITGLNFTDPLAVALFSTAGLVFAFLLVHYLARRFLPETPFWLVLAAIPALGFGSVLPYLARRPLHYEVAISAGYAFAFASIYCFVVGTMGDRFRRGLILWGSLLLGLAAGSRPPMLAAGLVPGVLALSAMVSRRDRPIRDHLITLLAFFGPLTVCVGLLLVYNVLRFGSWTEFGVNYTLIGVLPGGETVRTYKFYDIARVPFGLFYYVLAPPHFTAEFPFIFPQAWVYLIPPANYYLEPVAGILPVCPLVIIWFFAPVLWLKSHGKPGPLWLVGGAIAGVGAVLLAQFTLAAVTMRYVVDFATLFLVPALLLWYGCLNALRGPAARTRTALSAVFLVLLAVTVIVQTGLSFVGASDNFKHGSPQTYEAVHALFRPLEVWLRGGASSK
jgi:hypothetical protein